MLENYSRVRVLTNRYQNVGVNAGDVGYIIEVYNDAYEVEFSNADGITVAQIVLQPNEMELYEPNQPTLQISNTAA